MLTTQNNPYASAPTDALLAARKATLALIVTIERGIQKGYLPGEDWQVVVDQLNWLQYKLESELETRGIDVLPEPEYGSHE